MLDRALLLINTSLQLYEKQQEAGGAAKTTLNPVGGGGEIPPPEVKAILIPALIGSLIDTS